MALVPIITARLELRALAVGDVDDVFSILSDDTTTAAVSWRQTTRAGAEAWLDRRRRDEERCGVSMWAMQVGDDLVGLCGYFPRGEPALELGYVVHARYWGGGYATEAVTAAVQSAVGAGYEVYATIRPSNLASRRVAERAGLRMKGAVEHDRGTLLRYEFDRSS